jgi:ABC-type cobalamin transport system permease subunit
MKSNNLIWSWRNVRFTAVIAAIPVIIIAIGHVEAGLSLLLGALPASIMGLPLTRKQRRKIIVVGILVGVS